MQDERKIQLGPEWLSILKDEFQKPYMDQLRSFLLEEKQKGKVIYPAGKDIFNALNSTPFSKVKVVILGQDPYHGQGQAHGLSFSVLPGTPIPPSLVNIYKEMATDLGIPPASHGYLAAWAEQGVLLLNSVLTVEQNRAASHRNRGWETFTDRIVREIDAREQGTAFILWGSYAQKKGAFINLRKHFVIRSPHPSPLSASRGFFGSRPFSQVNNWLQENGQPPINWQIPPIPAT